MNKLWTALGSIAFLAVAGCGEDNVLRPPQECTLIGCTSGVHVTLTNPPAQQVKVELLDAATGNTLRTVECSSNCRALYWFENYRATVPVRIRVTTQQGVHTTDPITLQYVESRPNGPQCEPLCFQADVSLALPTLSPTTAKR